MWAGALPLCADAIDEYVRARLDSMHVAGVSIAVVKDGAIVKSGGYGAANLELHVPATAATVYRIASLTKPLTAEGVLLLVREGKVDLDATIDHYLVGTPTNWKSVTVRQLLQHTSGIVDYLNGVNGGTCNGTTPEEIVANLGRLPLEFAPGSRVAYSNSGYLVLGMLLERLGGKRYDLFLQQRIFEPLGMTSTRREDPYEIIADRAAGYVWIDGRLRNAKPPEPTLVNNADAGLLSTAPDLARWAISLDKRQILDERGYRLMETPIQLADGSTQPWGTGWNIDGANGRRRIWRDGNRADGSAYIGRYPDQKLTVIVLTNTSDAHPVTLGNGIAAMYAPELAPSGDATTDPVPEVTARLRAVLLRFQNGTIDASPFTPEWSSSLPDVANYLKRLFAAGPLRSLTLSSREAERPVYHYQAVFGELTVAIDLTLAADGRIHEMSVGAQ